MAIADRITSCLYNDIFAGTLVVSNAHYPTREHGKHIFIVGFQVHPIVHTVPMQDRMMPHAEPRSYMNAFQWQRSMKERQHTIREVGIVCNTSIHAFFIRQAHHGVLTRNTIHRSRQQCFLWIFLFVYTLTLYLSDSVELGTSNRA